MQNALNLFPPKVKFHTLGCRLNFFETDGIYSKLAKVGFRLAEESEIPNYIVINTCTVTNKADVKNRSIIRQAVKNYPGAKLFVTGCYAQTDREALERIPGVFKVLGNDQKSDVSRQIELDWLGKNSDSELPQDRFAYSDVLPEGHTRAYLKIQDGCNRKCSYCKIPLARGLGVSRKEEDILDQVRYLQDHGVGEIQLTGVNLGWYRNENGEKGFLNLLGKILAILDYSRLRLSSIEPPDVGNDLADLLTHPRFCKFLHVPIQSGSRKILREMQRTYHPEGFRKRIEAVLKKVPEIFLGTDAIVGFPGESILEFQETEQMIRELSISKIHAFPYSVRKGTKAENLGDPIPGDEKKRRVLHLMRLSDELNRKYAMSQFGKKEEAILETDGTLVTGNYLKGKLGNGEGNLTLSPGQFVEIEIGNFDSEGVLRFELLASLV